MADKNQPVSLRARVGSGLRKNMKTPLSVFCSKALFTERGVFNGGNDLLSDAVLHALAFFLALGVVEAAQVAHQIAGNAADAVKGMAVFFLTAALGAGIADDAVVAAVGVAVNGVIDGAVADAEVVIQRTTVSKASTFRAVSPSSST